MTEKYILDKIDEWHLDYDGPLELHEYMGWTWDQYTDYVMNGVIPK